MEEEDTVVCATQAFESTVIRTRWLEFGLGASMALDLNRGLSKIFWARWSSMIGKGGRDLSASSTDVSRRGRGETITKNRASFKKRK